MDHEETLRGGCSCGRNRYIVQIPKQATEIPTVFFDNRATHRRSQATPLSAWLRIPLSWYTSTTEAFLDDETPSAIRRTYTSPHEQYCKRHFCGFCGTPLSYWSESPASEAHYISLTLGSLRSSDLSDLEDMGFLPAEVTADAEKDKTNIESVVVERQQSSVNGVEVVAGLPWFEKMVEGSRLGNIRRSWGAERSGDGRYKVEWEIMEWTESDDVPKSPAKRKIGEVDEDAAMAE